jgi:DinB superfamily
MQGSIFDAAARARILERLDSVSPASESRWGKMTVAQAVAHMGDQIRLALGEISPSGGGRAPFRWAPMRHLAIHVMAWPQGKTQAPQESFTTSPREFAADVSRLRELIERVGARDEGGEWPVSTIFGRMTGRDWGVLTWRHLDHHLRQFGC